MRAPTAIAENVRTTAHQGGRAVKTRVTLLLGFLLLWPGLTTAADPGATQGQPKASSARELPQKLDLNRVGTGELEAVPGIGPRMAQAIVELRAKKGSFARLEELLEVTGIKEKKLAAIAGYLEIVPPQKSASSGPAAPAR